jgi:hypothetical protein
MTWWREAGGYSKVAVIVVCGVLLGAGAALAQEAKGKAVAAATKDEPEEDQTNAVVEAPQVVVEGLRIKSASVSPRDADTVTVTFDISWTNSWRYGNAFDAVWVFFKVRGDEKSAWQHANLAADKVLNPTGFTQAKGGTALEFVVPDDRVGMIVRRAGPGDGLTSAQKVTAILDKKSIKGVADLAKASVKAIGIEMVFIPEGAFVVGRGNGLPAKYAGKGSGGQEQNWFYKHNGKPKDTLMPLPYRNGGDVDYWIVGVSREDQPPYRIENEGAIPTGKKKGALWAVGLTPEDGGELSAAFPKGHAAFYCMKRIVPTAGQYAEFLNTLTEAQAKPRFYEHGHGMDIKRTGTAPNTTYTAPDPDALTRWISYTDGAFFAAWAGLRPTTELEYEKFYRGIRPAIPNDAFPSCYGVDGTAMAGLYERPVSVASAIGRGFKGTHGSGAPELPGDWPADIRGAILRNDYFYGAAHVPTHLLIGGRMSPSSANADRHGWMGTAGSPSACWTLAGWRGARTSPAGDTGVGPVTGELDLEATRLTKLPKPFQLDGSFDEWADAKPAAVADSPVFVFPVHERYPTVFTPTWWHGPKDFSAKAWVATDGDALLVAGEVSDDKHLNDKSGTDIYIGDCMQVGLVNIDGAQWNIGAALTTNGVALQQWDGPNETLIKSAKCAIKRDEAAGVTRYEFRLPFADFGAAPGVECSFYFNFFDNDGFMTVKRDGNTLVPVPQVRRIQWSPERTEPFVRRNYPKFVFAQ